MRSEGLETWKAPAPMNRMWSVRTSPKRVLTVVPSMIGRRSRWTPSRLTSGPCPDSRPAILSTSSRKMMPGLLDALDGQAGHLVHVDEASLLLFEDELAGLLDLHPPALGPAAQEAGQELLDLEADLLDPGIGDDLEGRRRLFLDLHLDRPVVEEAVAELGPELLPGIAGTASPPPPRRRRRPASSAAAGGCRGASPRRCRTGLLLDLRDLLLLDHVHGDADEVPDHGLDVPADVADLGELAGLDLEERRARSAWPAAARSRSSRRPSGRS